MAYATLQQLADYLNVSVINLPPNSEKLLDSASDVIDYVTIGRINTLILEQQSAAQKATCQQVEYWMTVGEDRDISGADFKSISIGTFSATFDEAAGIQSQTLSPRSRRTLFLAGMLNRGVRMI